MNTDKSTVCVVSENGIFFFLFLLTKKNLVLDQSFCVPIANIAPRIKIRSVLMLCFKCLSNDI